MQKKQAIIIVTALAAIVIVGLAIFYFFFMSKETPPAGGGSVVPPIETGTGDTTPAGGTGGTAGGGTTPSDTGVSSGTSGVSTEFENKPKTFSKLRQLSSLPVAGETMYERNAETIIRYAERGHGHIYETKANSTDAPQRISNTTIIPKIYEAYFVKKGQALIIRYLKGSTDEIQTFYTSLKQSATSTGELSLSEGVFLPTGISSLSVSPSQDKIFYLLPSQNGALGFVSNPDGSKRAQIFESPLNEWLSLWNQESKITLITKPSAFAAGYAYFVNPASGAKTRVVGDVFGLTVLPNFTSSMILYSSPGQDRLGMEILDTAKSSSAGAPVSTLPEKCLWSKIDKNSLYCAVPSITTVGDYPDSWYRGNVTFADNIVKVNLATGEKKVVLEPRTLSGQDMDITNLALNEKENYLMFTNKKDLTLWLLDMSAE